MSSRSLRLALKEATQSSAIKLCRGRYKLVIAGQGGDSGSSQEDHKEDGATSDNDADGEGSAKSTTSGDGGQVAISTPVTYDSEDERALASDLASMVKDAITAIVKAVRGCACLDWCDVGVNVFDCVVAPQNESKPTATTILSQLKSLYKVDDMSVSQVSEFLKEGSESGWLIPEDDGVYYLKEPVQTPDRVHRVTQTNDVTTTDDAVPSPATDMDTQ